MKLRIEDSELKQAACDYFEKLTNAKVKPEQLLLITRTEGQFEDAVTSVVGYEIDVQSVQIKPEQKRIDMDPGDECNEIKELLGKCTPAAIKEFAAFLAGRLITQKLSAESLRATLSQDLQLALELWGKERRSAR